MLCLAWPDYSHAADTAIMLQQTPVNGGNVEPGVGIHRYGQNSSVTLKAVPQPGYEFVYWIGDVSDPTSSSTTTYSDAPKIIIAVFERSEYDYLEASDITRRSPGRGALYGSPSDIVARSNSPVAGKRPHKYYGPTFPDDIGDDLLGPGDDLVGPDVPEPATVALLVSGGSALMLRKRK